MLSDNYVNTNNIVFIHIPKNAGTSFKKVCEKLGVLYLHHNFLLSDIVNKKQIIVLRDPIDRFISSVNYTLQHREQEKLSDKIINCVTNPNDWASIMFDSNHSLYTEIWRSILNLKQHKFNNEILEYRWHWSPQYLWFLKPDYIIIYDRLIQDFSLLSRQICQSSVMLPKINTSYGNKYISAKNKEEIRQFYAIDNQLYLFWQNTSPNTRLQLHND
jgi:hypothetical protein